MKRMRMNKVFRRGLIVGAVLLSLSSIGLIIKEYRGEHIREEKKTIYEYSMKSNVNYIVHVKPNMLYEGKELGEDQMYLTEFVDYIAADFTSAFTGSEKTDIEGKYGISAEVRGYTTKDEQKQMIWSKIFELEAVQNFKQTSDKHVIKKEVKINFPEYNKFAKTVLEASKVNIDVELVVKLNGNKTMNIPGGPLKDEMQPSITIPLNNGYFNITKEGTNDKSDVMTETIKIPVPINQKWIMVCSGLIGTGIAAVILILLGTAPFNYEDLKKKRIKKIINNHGSRMAAIDQIKITDNLETYHVITIEDLIKIADEIEKPVLYEAQENILEITKFYVKEQEILYIYEIEEKPGRLPTVLAEDTKADVQEDVKADLQADIQI